MRRSDSSPPAISSRPTLFASLASLASLALVACAEPAPRPPRAGGAEVPANSLSEARLQGDPKGAAEPSATTHDPSQPYMTRIEDAPVEGKTDTRSTEGKTADAGRPNESAKGGAKTVTTAECEQLMDRYLELELRGNAKLAGVDPEVIAQAKEMARQQNGPMPCDATHAQYTCGMAATSTAAWQRCLKKK